MVLGVLLATIRTLARTAAKKGLEFSHPFVVRLRASHAAHKMGAVDQNQHVQWRDL